MKKMVLTALLLGSLPLCADEATLAKPKANVQWNIAKGLFKTVTGLGSLGVASLLTWNAQNVAFDSGLFSKKMFFCSTASLSVLSGSIALLDGAYKDFKSVYEDSKQAQSN